ncbi:MAG: hypothetical protein LBC73_09895 [Oscillospiraceae bacterium]|jgi:Tfp pilus assembly protein PilO|nr:hypothetical protein [Oscillospiraceae bacterium]
MKITKREKMLIFIVAIVGAVTLVAIFGVVPMLERLDIANEENRLLDEEVNVVRSRIENRFQYEDENRLANERFTEITLDYPVLVTNEEIDSALTNLCLSNNLRPTSWSVRPFDRPTPDDLFVIISVSMSVVGTYDSFLNLLDDVDEKQHIRIVSMSYLLSRDLEDDEFGVITLAFELTYLNPQ